jgi:hypothetical protein
MENKRSKGCAISSTPFILTTLVLFVLKLCGVVTCSWWWVFAPLLLFPGIVLSWMIIAIIIAIIAGLLTYLID